MKMDMFSTFFDNDIHTYFFFAFVKELSFLCLEYNRHRKPVDNIKLIIKDVRSLYICK